jgi:hypothetical protein
MRRKELQNGSMVDAISAKQVTSPPVTHHHLLSLQQVPNIPNTQQHGMKLPKQQLATTGKPQLPAFAINTCHSSTPVS